MASLWFWLGLAPAFFIAYEDFRYRRIHLLWFLLLAGLGVGHRIAGWQQVVWLEWGINALSIGLVVGGAVLWYRLRYGGPVMDQQLGWGDVVMLGVMGIWLTPMALFTAIGIGSGVLALLVLLLQACGWLPKSYPIPFAGFLAIWLILVLFSSFV